MSRFNNSRFYKICLEYISDENMLYGVIDEINRALFQAALRGSEKRILRPFFHPSDSSKVLEISALLLPRQQSISIIIARTKVTRSALPTALSVGLSASVSR